MIVICGFMLLIELCFVCWLFSVCGFVMMVGCVLVFCYLLFWFGFVDCFRCFVLSLLGTLHGMFVE